MNDSWMKYASNPKGFTVKKWLSSLLESRYAPFDNIAERIGMSLVTDQDLKEFGQLLSTIYECGYLRAMQQTKKQLDEMGIKVRIVNNPQSLKSGDTGEGEQETKKPED